MGVRATDKNPDKFVGLRFPMTSNLFSTFNQSKTLLEQTKSNLRNLLFNVNNIFVVQDAGNPNLVQIQLEYFIETEKESLENITFNFNRSVGA